jgi:hypothetical protein
MIKVKCGDANPKGNIQFTYKGGCDKELDIREAYRCVGCSGWFHLDCILKHFELEKDHDVARNAIYKIKRRTKDTAIIKLCDEGLRSARPVKKFSFMV